MFKNVAFTTLQFLLFLLVSFIGITLPVLHIIPSHITPLAGGMRGFEWDGVILMLVTYILIIVVEVVRKRVTTAGAWTTLALILAGLAEFAMKLGIRDI